MHRHYRGKGHQSVDRPLEHRRERRGSLTRDRSDEALLESDIHVDSMRTGAVLAFVLTDGTRMTGHVEWYDRACVCVRRNDGVSLVLYKSAVRDARPIVGHGDE